MAYRYRSRRSARRLARKSRRNFIITLLLIALLLYATLQWILPFLIEGIGTIQGIIKPSQKQVIQESPSLAPPVLNIPYEATNTAQISITGYATPDTKVSIYVDDTLADSTQSSEDGSFEIKNITLNLGTNNIFGKTSNDKGESLPSKTIKVILDNEKPTLEISEPEDGKTIQGDEHSSSSSKKVKVSGKTEFQAQVFVNELRAVVNLDGSFTLDYPLNDGENILTIKAQDQAQNSQEVERKVTFKPQETQ